MRFRIRNTVYKTSYGIFTISHILSCVPRYYFCTISGDKESGKTTLIAKLQGNEDPKKGSGLEYGYIDVRDEYRDGMYLFINKFPSNLLPPFYLLFLKPCC
jgi:hypothetical protein